MKIGKLHLNCAQFGFGVAWIEPKARGTWHFALALLSLSFQIGHIGRAGFGGYLWSPKIKPCGTRGIRVGRWEKPVEITP